ncbi:MAG: hypothetical protein ACHQEM_12790, partial [Chitinophagales bacterium]
MLTFFLSKDKGMLDKNKELLDWYEGLSPNLDAFTRPPGPEGTANADMEIEIRPREPDNVVKIEKQAEGAKAMLYARSLIPLIEKWTNEDGENATKKEIQHVIS